MTITNDRTHECANEPNTDGIVPGVAPAFRSDRWPMLGPVPRGPRAQVSAAVCRRIFDAATRRLGITVSYRSTGSGTSGGSETNGGSGTDAGSGAGADLVLHRPEEFFARVGTDGLIGFGESYLTGAWDAPHLAETLTVLCQQLTDLVPKWMQRLRAAYVRRPPADDLNSEDNTRDNIGHHYDLSNDLFRLFLDESLSYSSGLFDHLPADEDLETAQHRKIDRLLDEARVGDGTRVLEIGTGWGELAIRAAARGATVRSVTLSVEQQQLARERIADAADRLGFSADRVQVDLLDYRAVTGEYDAIVSVEMIEAVGHEFWATYFAKIDSLLAPGGTVAIQAITMPHLQMLATRYTYTWINKYIFPGGFLPSTEAIDQITRQHTSLRVANRLQFGRHYAETLRRWDERFLAASEEVLALGFDQRFLRMWHFYLEYSRAGFASGYLDVQQLTFTREDS
ncbi:MAG TPA: class I SAM-dependent methyltransferase [Marmoricola sp.]|nr:class I SAM-dependent methyltransferase [Marmoricola sp.]